MTIEDAQIIDDAQLIKHSVHVSFSYVVCLFVVVLLSTAWFSFSFTWVPFRDAAISLMLAYTSGMPAQHLLVHLHMPPTLAYAGIC